MFGYGIGDPREEGMFRAYTGYSNGSILINDFIHKMDYVGRRTYKIGDIGIFSNELIMPVMKEINNPENIDKLQIFLKLDNYQMEIIYII